jgi:hypothetical protein
MHQGVGLIAACFATVAWPCLSCLSCDPVSKAASFPTRYARSAMFHLSRGFNASMAHHIRLSMNN